MARQPVERLDEVEQHAQAPLAETGGAQLRQVAQRGTGVAGTDVRERLGDRVDLARRQRQRRAHVAYGVTDPVRVEHRHARHPVAAERGQYRVVHLGAPGRLDVEVDVRQRLPQRRQEPLEDEVVADRVDAGDAQQVVDEAARARATRGAADVEPSDEPHDVGDGEEVRGEAEVLDDRQLLGQALLDRGAGPRVPVAHPRLATLPQRADRLDLAAAHPQHVELGKVDLAEADVGARVERTLQAQVAGLAQQPVGATGAPARPCGDPLGHLAHRLGALEVALGVAAVDVAHVERYEPARGVEHVDRHRLSPLGHPYRVGEHRRHRRGRRPARPCVPPAAPSRHHHRPRRGRSARSPARREAARRATGRARRPRRPPARQPRRGRASSRRRAVRQGRRPLPPGRSGRAWRALRLAPRSGGPPRPAGTARPSPPSTGPSRRPAGGAGRAAARHGPGSARDGDRGPRRPAPRGRRRSPGRCLRPGTPSRTGSPRTTRPCR